jgi:hypothetical protein
VRRPVIGHGLIGWLLGGLVGGKGDLVGVGAEFHIGSTVGGVLDGDHWIHSVRGVRSVGRAAGMSMT